MRKFIVGSIVTGLLVALATLAMPVSESQAHCYGRYCMPKVPKKPASQQQSTSHVGEYWLFCGLATATSEIVGAAVNGNSATDPRQSTIFEAGWYAAACPAMLPWALLVSATCPDNRATLAIARLAHRYGLTHPSADWTPFTNAYGQACRDGTLSPAFLAFA